VGREFYGIWGDFDVKITLPKAYTIGATGYLQNKNEIGHGYQDKGINPDHSKIDKLTWHFFAPNVHDFFWGADPDYVHDKVSLDDTTEIHFFYQNEADYAATWKQSQETMLKAFRFIGKTYGDYPYRQYSFVQGGDGGMEYAMGTLITGRRPYNSLVGVMIHELMHNWFQMLMGSNEALHAWMDEGFTSFSSEVVSDHLFGKGNTKSSEVNIHNDSYLGYFGVSAAGIEEPLSTHADHFMTNTAYGTAAYSKGEVFLHQLEYIIGKEAFDKGMLEYYNSWRFKHPKPNDFIRVMEKTAGLELDWYKEYWVNSIHTIDYAVKSVAEDKKDTKIVLERKEWNEKENKVKNGRMPMPVDLVVEYKDGNDLKKEYFYIPLDLMRGEKADESFYGGRTVLKDWWWTHKTYEFEIPFKYKNIVSVKIDPSGRMADIKADNNKWVQPQSDKKN
jgi:aminopeptidase N